MLRSNQTVALTLALVAVATFVTPAKALQNGLARTPPMGWNSWYTAHCGVTEKVVLRNATALVDTGMARLGYRYVNLDGCWEAPRRDTRGRLHADRTRFPHGMAALGRAIHALGRRMLVTVSTPGVRKPWRWAAAYGNSWRIGADANGTWRGVMAALDLDAPLWGYAGPGGWNDPDILQVGDGVLTRAEERAHFSLWSML